MKMVMLVCSLLLVAQTIAAKGLSSRTIMALKSGRILPSWSPKLSSVNSVPIHSVMDGQMPSYLREGFLAEIASSPQKEQEANDIVEGNYDVGQVKEFNQMLNLYKHLDSIADKYGKASFGEFSASELESIAVIEFEENTDKKKLFHLMAMQKRQGENVIKWLRANRATTAHPIPINDLPPYPYRR